MNYAKHEFSGFLMGEGCFRLAKKKDSAKTRGWKNTAMYVPIITVSLRADDAEVLKWAKQEYGGTLMLRSGRPQIPNQNPYYMWIVTGARSCLRIINDFLATKLPSQKKEQASLLKTICQLKIRRQTAGHKGNRYRWYSEQELNQQDQAYQTLKRLKLYVK